MPLEETENEVRARLQSSDKFDPDSFRRGAFPPNNPERGVFGIYGCPKGEWKNNRCQVGMQIQSLRFSKDAGWTLAKARAWLKAHDFVVASVGTPPYTPLKINYLASLTAAEDHYARIWLIDTNICKNNWRVTDEALERAAKSLIGKPLMIGHGAPKGSEVGVFTDYQKEDGCLYGLCKITDEETWEHIKAGDWQAVSVEFTASKVTCSVCGADITKEPCEHILNREGHEIIEEFTFDSVALVEAGAYPRAKVEEINGIHNVWSGASNFSKRLTAELEKTRQRGQPRSDQQRLIEHFGEGTALKLLELVGEDAYKLLPERGARLAKVPPSGGPLAPENEPWDLSTAEINELPDAAFAWIHPDYPEKSSDKRLRKLPHHKMIGGTLKVVWRGVTAAMAVLLGARGGVDIPRDEKRKVYNHLVAHYRQFDKEPPEFRAEKMEEKKMTDQEERIAELEAQVKEQTEQMEAMTKERDAAKEKIKAIEQEQHEAKVAELLDLRVKAELTKEDDRKAEAEHLGELPDAALDQLTKDTKKLVEGAETPPDEPSEPNPKAKPGESLSAIEETRKRLFGFTRDRMASEGGKIVG